LNIYFSRGSALFLNFFNISMTSAAWYETH
jgi:hypothetical protein